MSTRNSKSSKKSIGSSADNILSIKDISIWIFALITIVSTSLFFLVGFLTDGCNIAFYFTDDYQDVFMDYFNMLNCVRRGDPYYAHSNYPAMCFLILKIFFQLVPNGAIATKSRPREEAFDLRDYMPAMLSYTIIVMICVLVVCLCMRKLLRDKSEKCKNMVVVAFLFSGPILFMINRGNLIMIALASVMVFFAFYDSPEQKWRYIASVALAFAASIKLYPIVFVLLILRRDRIGEFITAILAFLIFLILPFFLFNGVDSIKSMIEGIFLSSSEVAQLGFGYNYSFKNAVDALVSFITGNLVELHFSMLIPVGCCLVLYIVSCQTWEKIFALSLMCVWVPSFSYTYSLVFFIPFILAIFNVDMEGTEKKYPLMAVVLGALIFALWSLPRFDFGVFGEASMKFPLEWGCVIGNIAIFILFIMIFTHSVIFRIGKRKETIDTAAL